MKKRLSSFFTSRTVRFLSELVLLVASSYLLLKKLIGFSVSGWLLNNALQQPLVNLYVIFSVVILIIAIVVRGIALYFDRFPVSNYSAVEPGEISDCLDRMNSEIIDHLTSCERNSPESIRSINDQHGFSRNMALIVSSLAEHIRKSASTGAIKIKNKSLFISLYTYESSANILKYELHYDPKRDLVESRCVYLDSEDHKKYEMVKCITETKDTAYVLNAKRDYARGASKRYKTIKHYMGCKLTRGPLIFGFLNIEFHYNNLFSDEEEMRDYMEDHVYPFKLLLEYQYLKRKFFDNLNNS